ncbi:MAG: hypothetical protein E5Y74_00060 [Mesorhizobium sp.]|nr:MAG: hypothetical protein E5Y74_00060 [Mesorhizobium sp.]
MAKTKWPKIPSYMIPLFQCSRVYLCTTREEWVQAHEHLSITPNDTRGVSGCVRHLEDDVTGKNMYLMAVFDGTITTLLHECAHACFYVCSDIGVTIQSDQPNETYCYMLERMFSHFQPNIKPLSE